VLRLANPYGPGVDAGQAKGAVADDAAAGGTRASRSRSSAARRGLSVGSATSSAAIRLVLEADAEGTFNVGADGEPVALVDVAAWRASSPGRRTT
jgi:nucleoside-diphosphate-sugar epimerase